MIRLLTQITQTDTVLSGYLNGYYGAYGAEQSFLQFYGDEHGNQLAVMDGTATVCWKEINREELLLFLFSQPNVRTVRTDAKTGVALAEFWGTEAVIRPVMKCEIAACAEGVTDSPSPRILYPFLVNIFPEMPSFEPWYLDVSHRLRHGFCHICAAKSGEEVISSAMTVAEWTNGAMIGAVATHEGHRSKGLAARCVTNLTAELQAAGKTVYISPKTEKAKRLYERLRFSVCDELAIVERK